MENINNINTKNPLTNQNLIFQERKFGREQRTFKNIENFEPQRRKSLRINNMKENIDIQGLIILEKTSKMNIEGITSVEIQENQDNYMSKIMANEDAGPDEADLVDQEEQNNPQYVVSYAKEIYEYLLTQEEKYQPKADYMKEPQKDINEKMRGILIDWLVDVHLKFKLLPETLYLTINLIDRYLSHVAILREKLQLVGVSALLIASKYEEIYPPEPKEFAYVTDKAYTIDEIFQMEGQILQCLNFNLTITSSYRFLERYSRICRFNTKSFQIARYLLELALVEYRMLKYTPSKLACSAIYLVNKIEKRSRWPDFMVRTTKYKETQLRATAKDLYFLLQNVEKSSLQAVRRKFSSTKFLQVSNINIKSNE